MDNSAARKSSAARSIHARIPSRDFSRTRAGPAERCGNAVLRWEYRPGSTVFVVWQQERSDFEGRGDFSAGRDIGAIFRTVPTNVFLVKATYWIGR